MTTTIRLKRGGHSHNPNYRVVVVDSRKRARGRVLDEIGIYQPCARPEPVVEIDAGRASEWLARGARPSETVRSVLRKKGITGARSSPSGALATDRGGQEAKAPSES